MTSADFQQRCPKPWHLVRMPGGFSLRAANGTAIAYLSTAQRHTSIPQNEWNRHFAAALAELLPVLDESPTAKLPTISD